MGNIGENIKKYREMRGLSQEQLADMVGKTRSAISQYESGKIIPRMGAVEDLADALGVKKSEITSTSISYFMVNTDECITHDDHELMSLFHKMDDAQQAVLLSVAYELARKA